MSVLIFSLLVRVALIWAGAGFFKIFLRQILKGLGGSFTTKAKLRSNLLLFLCFTNPDASIDSQDSFFAVAKNGPEWGELHKEALARYASRVFFWLSS